MHRLMPVIPVLIAIAGANHAHAGVISFVNDFDGWLEAAGGVAQEIDFETLPDGSPSQAGFPITEDFNYTDQGVTFSRTPTDVDGFLIIVGNDVTGFGLLAEGLAFDVGIISDLVEPAFAAAVFFGGNTTFSIFSEDGILLGEETFVGGGEQFLGFVSDIPIGHTLNTRDSTFEIVSSFLFVPVPEPGTLALLGLVALAVVRRR